MPVPSTAPPAAAVHTTALSSHAAVTPQHLVAQHNPASASFPPFSLEQHKAKYERATDRAWRCAPITRASPRPHTELARKPSAAQCRGRFVTCTPGLAGVPNPHQLVRRLITAVFRHFPVVLAALVSSHWHLCRRADGWRCDWRLHHEVTHSCGSCILMRNVAACMLVRSRVRVQICHCYMLTPTLPAGSCSHHGLIVLVRRRLHGGGG